MLTSWTTIEGGEEHGHEVLPPHPGELVGDNLAELGVSVSEAARACWGLRASSFTTSLLAAADLRRKWPSS